MLVVLTKTDKLSPAERDEVRTEGAASRSRHTRGVSRTFCVDIVA